MMIGIISAGIAWSVDFPVWAAQVVPSSISSISIPVYLFMLKKEQEGKPYNVAKMAAVNKFLRIYYARAMELYK